MISRLLTIIKYKPIVQSYPTCTKRLCSSGHGHPECKERPRNPFYDPYYEESVWCHRPRCYWGRKSVVTMAAGVGTGPELMEVVKRVCVVANAPVIFEEIAMGEDADDDEMDNLIYSIERNGVAIKGNIEPKYREKEDRLSSDVARNVKLRKSLDLFVNLLEIKSFPGLMSKTRLKTDVDMVLVRQNTEGEYSMLEHETGRGIENLKVTTKYNTRRLAAFAFKYAATHNRPRVTLVYNRELMQISEIMFLEMMTDVATKYPDITFSVQSMHALIHRVSQSPLTFPRDVIVTGVLYGGLIAALLFGLTSGTGLICGQNLGPRYAVFEPAARNKGYKLAGKDATNPLVALMCAVNMLKYLGHMEVADRIERAIRLTVDEDKVHTSDMLGTASCSQVLDNVERRIREVMPEGYNKPLGPFSCDSKMP